MTERLTPPLNTDDLCLAQLACSRLARLIEGTLTIGLPALITGVPEPGPFLEERFRVLSAFALVLHSIPGKSRNPREVERHREKSDAVTITLEDLRLRLLGQMDRPSLPSGEVRASTSALCDALAGYAGSVDLDPALIVRMKTVVLHVFDALGAVHGAPTASTG